MKRPGATARLPLPFRVINQRVAFLGLFAAAIGLMIFGKTETPVVEAIRTRVTDAFIPVIEALARPASAVSWVSDRLALLAASHSENARLREENHRLLEWEQLARRLEAENRVLRELLRFTPEQTATGTSARVIADAGGSYARSVVIAAGSRDGVARGQIAVAAEGLVGRVGDVGERGSRVLLITDLNSQVPVLIESSRQRAILAGDNSERPRLVFFGAGTRPQVGDRVVTSGHGGVFPPGLPVGTILGGGDDLIRVQPFVDLGRLEQLRVLDYGIQGLLPTPAPPPAGGPRRGQR
ncbi:MAG: rod shape-determining protein MreC [Alphaproteobacteria bacterium]|nr:rod shape-determining protein MreC [Alphaproteobacteria bacterium]